MVRRRDVDSERPGTNTVAPEGIDLDHPTAARVYDWLLGGTANWAIDREFGAVVVERFPLLRSISLANRLFLHRAVRHLAGLGVRQFIDVGAGIPTMGNTHQAADEVAPDSKVVYIDNEPVAVAHSKILLETEGDPARHAAIQADLREPDHLWEEVVRTGVIDFDQPVALLLVAVLHFQQLRRGADVGRRPRRYSNAHPGSGASTASGLPAGSA